jgi:hypothetical protein
MKEPWFTIDLIVMELRTKYYFIWVDCSLFTTAPAKSEKVDRHKGKKGIGKAATNHFKVYFYKSL